MSQQLDVPLRLASVPLFDGLSPGDLRLLAAGMVVLPTPSGETVLAQGELSDNLFVISAGSVEVSVRTGSASSVVVARLGPGEFFGEISLLSSQACTASVVTREPTTLLRLGRADYLAYLAQRTELRDRLLDSSSRRAGGTLQEVTRAVGESPAPFDQLLRRLIDHEIDAMRAAEIRGDPVAFDEVVQFYGSTRFLYPAKLGMLEPRFAAVRETWERLIAANNDVFKILLLRRVVGAELVVKNSICAFRFAPDAWQVQHLVSAERHEYSATLASVIGIIDWVENATTAQCIRLSYRPDNPGTARLFDSVAEALPTHMHLRTVCDYYLTDLSDTASASSGGTDPDPYEVRIAAPQDLAAVGALYAARHPSLPRWLSAEDPAVADLDRAYAGRGLRRTRSILVARKGAQILGTIACWSASEGINFSFLENSIEDMYLDETLRPPEAVSVVRALLLAAARLYREQGRSYVVALLDSQHRDLVDAAGVLAASDKQYALLAVGRTETGFATSRTIIEGYYSSLLQVQVQVQGSAGQGAQR
jgi:CRP/FNR family transcriptional regulator, cyclic AMP receptor protein